MSHNLEFKEGFFYTTIERPCPYFLDRLERKVLTELTYNNGIEIYNTLSKCGFRRSSKICYTQICENCSDCISLRVVANEFKQNRSFKRIFSKNNNVNYEIKEPIATLEQFELFKKYQDARHSYGEMASMSFEEYQDTIENSPLDTKIIEFRHNTGELYALILCDFLDDGISAVYLFFDTDYSQNSPGTFVILTMINEVIKLGLDYLYLGFWIPECQKMSYKSKFKPAEILTSNGWHKLQEII